MIARWPTASFLRPLDMSSCWRSACPPCTALKIGATPSATTPPDESAVMLLTCCMRGQCRFLQGRNLPSYPPTNVLATLESGENRHAKTTDPGFDAASHPRPSGSLRCGEATCPRLAEDRQSLQQ